MKAMTSVILEVDGERTGERMEINAGKADCERRYNPKRAIASPTPAGHRDSGFTFNTWTGGSSSQENACSIY
jgi:hypothetical protein